MKNSKLIAVPNNLKPVLSDSADTQLKARFFINDSKTQDHYRQSGCPIKKATIWGLLRGGCCGLLEGVSALPITKSVCFSGGKQAQYFQIVQYRH